MNRAAAAEAARREADAATEAEAARRRQAAVAAEATAAARRQAEAEAAQAAAVAAAVAAAQRQAEVDGARRQADAHAARHAEVRPQHCEERRAFLLHREPSSMGQQRCEESRAFLRLKQRLFRPQHAAHHAELEALQAELDEERQSRAVCSRRRELCHSAAPPLSLW